eukprot:353919-Chlamydomonas_euryale.AAC.14
MTTEATAHRLGLRQPAAPGFDPHTTPTPATAARELPAAAGTNAGNRRGATAGPHRLAAATRCAAAAHVWRRRHKPLRARRQVFCQHVSFAERLCVHCVRAGPAGARVGSASKRGVHIALQRERLGARRLCACAAYGQSSCLHVTELVGAGKGLGGG